MGTKDECRLRAAEAQRLADRATTKIDREVWLWMARCWRILLTMPPWTLAELFDQELAENGDEVE